MIAIVTLLFAFLFKWFVITTKDEFTHKNKVVFYMIIVCSIIQFINLIIK